MRRAGIPVVLASSAQPRVIRRAFALLRIEGVLTGETSADDVEKTKPFDDIFSLAIDRFRLRSRRPVAIGDTPYDIAVAHQLGVPCLAVRSGGFPLRTLASADGLFAGIAQLWEEGRDLFS